MKDEYTYQELCFLVNQDFKQGVSIDAIKKKYNQSFSIIYEILGFKDEDDFMDK